MPSRKTERYLFAEKYFNDHPDVAVGPTKVGCAMGFEYSKASSKMMSAFRALVHDGKIVQDGGTYRLKK